MVDSVGFEIDEAGRIDFPDLVPGEVGGFADKAGDDKGDGMEVVGAQDRKGDEVKVVVAIIESENDRFLWPGSFLFKDAIESVEIDGSVAVLGEVVHLGGELVRGDGEEVTGVVIVTGKHKNQIGRAHV